MAHDTDQQGNYIRLYTTTIGGVKYGITFAEIAKCLGRTYQDIGQLAGDVNASGVRVGSINMAAKYKPVQKDNMWVTKGEWWRGDDGMCGIAIGLYDDLGDFVDDMIYACKSGSTINFDASPLPWSYNPPRGTSAPGDVEPYRSIDDFNHYNRNAQFTKPRLQTDRKLIINTGGVIEDNNLYTIDYPDSVTYTDGSTLAAESLGLNDIKPTGTAESDAPLSDYYLGIIFVDCADTGIWVAATAEDALGDFVSGWVGMDVSNASSLSSSVANKEIAMIPFLSSEIISGYNSASTNTITGTFISAYGIGPTQAWIHRFGYIDLAISLRNIRWTGSSLGGGGDLLGNIDIEEASGPIRTQNITLSDLHVGVQRLKNGTWVDMGAGFTASSVTLYYGANEPASGTITLAPNGDPTNHNNIHMDETDPEFVYPGTYKITLYNAHSNPTENNPNTSSVFYSSAFNIG